MQTSPEGRRWFLHGILFLLVLPGCQGEAPTSSAEPISVQAAPSAPARSSLVPMPKVYPEKLGNHRLRIRSTIETRVPGAETRRVDQTAEVLADGKGGLHMRKDTHPQFGQEAILAGGALYNRMRWSRFIRRVPEPGEVSAMLDRVAGHLPAQLGLVERFLVVGPASETSFDGRPVLRQVLSRADTPRPASVEERGSRAWRRSLVVDRLSGELLLCKVTRLPLYAKLDASLRFGPPADRKPPRTGIPQVQSPTLTGTMTLALELEVRDIGRVPTVSPPPSEETITHPRRRRLEYERQILTGEIPIPEDWRPIP